MVLTDIIALHLSGIPTSLTLQMPAKERKGLLPSIHSLLGTVRASVVGPEGMACTIIPVKLVVLPTFLKLGFKLVDFFWGRVLVVITEKAQQRA